MEDPNYDLLPVGLRDGMRRYLEDGTRPGAFLSSCLQNNFINAVCRADTVNRFFLREIAEFMWNEMPATAWGSNEKFENWMIQKKKERKEKEDVRLEEEKI